MNSVTQTPQGNLRVLILATLAFATCFAGWALFSPLATYMKADFKLTSTSVGLLLAAPVLLGSIARVPIGVLTDKFGGRRVFSILLLFGFFPLFIAAFGKSYLFLLTCGFFFGIIGASFAVGVPQVSQWYPKEKQGLALGIYGVGNIGSALATFGAPFLAESIGWHKVFLIYSFPLLFMAFAYWFFVEDAPKPAGTKIPTFGDKMKVYKSSNLIWVFCLFYAMTFGFFVCFSLWLPSYLREFYGVTPIQAGSFTSVFVFVTTFARILGGYLSDIISGRRILIILSVVILCILIFLNLSVSFIIALMAFYLMGVCLGVGNGVIFKLVAEYFPKDTGAVGGMVGAAGGLGGFFLPIILGTLRDYTNNYSLGFIFVSLVCLMCLSFMEEKTLENMHKKSLSTVQG
ncbi:MAG: NarK/NasA family nitrate transporter [wastewater metagenome]|nr:NarK/NasA family nitrate transporter [Candidatus Loosdrechtia aerotolerans]